MTSKADDKLCGMMLKKSASKDVKNGRMMQGDTESLVMSGPGYGNADEVLESVKPVSESDDLCPGEGNRVQGNEREVDDKVDVCDPKKSRNLDEFGRVRRSGLDLLGKIQLFEQAQKGRQTQSEAERGSRHLKGNRGWN